MKCEICKRKTTIDSSVGYDEFIVCNGCHNALIGKYSIEKSCQVMSFILKCGEIRRNLADKK
ncbi:MAG: hypothetical protein J6T10_29895 [Methanobrevibacter sp.]|nr:hypothetical protein [Methanobrevibacter sp.]